MAGEQKAIRVLSMFSGGVMAVGIMMSGGAQAYKAFAIDEADKETYDQCSAYLALPESQWSAQDECTTQDMKTAQSVRDTFDQVSKITIGGFIVMGGGGLVGSHIGYIHWAQNSGGAIGRRQRKSKNDANKPAPKPKP